MYIVIMTHDRRYSMARLTGRRKRTAYRNDILCMTASVHPDSWDGEGER